MLTPAQIISKFKTAMQDAYGNRLEKIVLFGSRARGDFHKDSDFDFLIILKDKEISNAQEITRVNSAVYHIWEQCYIGIHYLHMTADMFYHAKTPLLYWVRKEGKEI